MQTSHQATIPASQVRALFADRAQSFSLASGATFADLAARLEHLGKWQRGLPHAIFLKFGAARQLVTIAQPVI
jgi:hypothetical protein